MDKTIYLKLEKETKGAVRYVEVNEDGTAAFSPVVGTQYIRKSALPGRVLPGIVLTLKEWNPPA